MRHVDGAFELEPARCTRFGRGHTVHWIQANGSVRDPGVVEHGVVTRVDFGMIEVRIGDELRRFRNHDTTTFHRLVRQLGRSVVIQDRWGLLKVPGPDGDQCFSISAESEPWTPCTPRRTRS